MMSVSSGIDDSVNNRSGDGGGVLFKTSVPMFLMFDRDCKPKRTTGTQYALTMDIDSMVLYTGVMQFYMRGVYDGEKLSNAAFDSMWTKVYRKFNALDKPDLKIYRKILSGVSSLYEFMQNNFSSGIYFIHQSMSRCNADFIVPAKLESRDKHAVFRFLWEHTDGILFNLATVDSIMTMLLLFTKVLIIQCIDDPEERRTMTANWTGSYIINYVCNNDYKFSALCDNIFSTDGAGGSVRNSIKNILKRHKIPAAVITGPGVDSEYLCKWARFRYLNKTNRGASDARICVAAKIDDYLKSNGYTVDSRHRVIFETWLVMNSVFGKIPDTDVYTELEMIKMQNAVSENNSIEVLRKIRRRLRSNDMIAVTDDNISSFMDVDLYNVTLKIATDMCESIGKNNGGVGGGNKQKYIKM